eukprot:4670531-Amphidinium_carterae.1
MAVPGGNTPEPASKWTLKQTVQRDNRSIASIPALRSNCNSPKVSSVYSKLQVGNGYNHFKAAETVGPKI